MRDFLHPPPGGRVPMPLYPARLFGHIARSSPQEDHHSAVAAVIRGLPPDWKRPWKT